MAGETKSIKKGGGGSNDNNSNNNKSIDFIFSEIVGGNGLWQWGSFLLMFSLEFVGGIPLLMHMFAAFTPEFRCRVPVCDNAVGSPLSSADLTNATWLQFAVPAKTGNTAEFLSDGSEYDPCHMYEPVDPEGGCVAENFKSSGNSSAGINCKEYLWDLSEFPETLTTKLGLVCDKQSQRRLLGSIMMVGLLIGSAVGGRVGDVIGRKKSMFVAVLIIGPTVVAGGYSENYITYVILRLITCSCLPMIWVNFQACIVECFGSKHRIGVMVVKDLMWPVTTFILAFFGYFFRHWTSLHLAVGTCCIAMLVAWFTTPESLRWLAQNGKREEAHSLLTRIAKWNRRKISPEQWEEIDEILDDIQDSAGHKIEQNLSPLTMFTKSYFRTSVVLIIAWVTANVGNYTLQLNATKLTGNIFLNFSLASIVDIPVALGLLFTLDRLGRRLNLSLSAGILGTCCLVLAFVPKDYTNVVLVFYLTGKACAGAAFMLVWLMTTELYPTNLRSQALGTCSMVARLFGIACPFVANLAVLWKPLPMVMLGVPSLLSAFLVMAFLPETAGKELPQNMLEGIELNRREAGGGGGDEKVVEGK